MAGLAKPSNAGLEATYTLTFSDYNWSFANILFDGLFTTSKSGSYIWERAQTYLDITINSKCNIYRMSGRQPDKVAMISCLRLEPDGTYTDVTTTYSLSLVNNTSWQMFIKDLPKGNYRFRYNGGIRIDSEWYIEAIDLILLKQNNQYYSIKADFYSEDLMRYEPLEGLDFSKGFNLDELFSAVTIGMGKSVDVTPTMTSYTTPAPYVASASSIYSATTPAWKAFNNTILNNTDRWESSSVAPCWIQLDFNKPKTINQFTLASMSIGSPDAYLERHPKDFSIQGSNDGVNFDIIKTFAGESGWVLGETRMYDLGLSVKYRYYRINVTANNGMGAVVIGEIRFLYNDPITEQFHPIDKFDNFTLISEKTSNTNYQAIKSSTELIVANNDIYIGKIDSINNINLIANDIVLDVTPTMTSNTAPAPYVASASNEYSTTYAAWNVFSEKTGQNDIWMTQENVVTGWVQLDFKTPTTINGFSMTSRNYSTTKNITPKNFNLEGSNDGVNFEIIKSFGNEASWEINEIRYFTLDNDVTYNIYRIVVNENQGSGTYNRVGISKIKFLHKKKNGVKIAISIDKGNTWISYNPETDNFFKLDCDIPKNTYENLTDEEKVYWEISKNEISEKGIDVDIFNALDFNRIKGDYIRFAYVLNRETYGDISQTDNMDWSFNSTGFMRLVDNSDCEIDIDEEKIECVSNIDSDMIKINVSV